MCTRTHGRTEIGSRKLLSSPRVCGRCRVPYADVRADARSQVISYVLSPINYVLGVEDQPKDGGAAARRFVNQFEAKVRHAVFFFRYLCFYAVVWRLVLDCPLFVARHVPVGSFGFYAF